MKDPRATARAGFKVIDWARTEAFAARLDLRSLTFHYWDCVIAAEAMESSPWTERDAGYYRDCAAVYRKHQQELIASA